MAKSVADRGSKPTNFSLEVVLANDRISNVIRKTPIDKSISLSAESGVNILLKHEHLQHTGSFKLRGASNKILKYLNKYKSSGIYTASTGNHGMATSFAASQLGVKVTVFVPTNIDSSKKEGIINYGSQLIESGNNCIDAENEAIKRSQQQRIPFISAYNDWDIILGQGTLAIEIFEQVKQQQPGTIDAVFVSVGGGGLIGGIAGYIKSVYPKCQIYGVQPVNSCVLYRSIQAGHIRNDVEEYATISDGTAGKIEEDSVTFALCRDNVDHWVTVSEQEIAASLFKLLKEEHMFVEGSAALALAGLLKSKKQLQGKTAVVVLCGRNVDIGRYFQTIKPFMQKQYPSLL